MSPEDSAPDESPLPLPRLPVRASIYIAPDGSVHFGALFADLVPVAEAIAGGREAASAAQAPEATEVTAQGEAQESGV